MSINTQHPLAGQHISQGSMDAAADAYEGEYLRAKIRGALDRMERTASGHAIGADKANDENGYQGGFAVGLAAIDHARRIEGQGE